MLCKLVALLHLCLDWQGLFVHSVCVVGLARDSRGIPAAVALFKLVSDFLSYPRVLLHVGGPTRLRCFSLKC